MVQNTITPLKRSFDSMGAAKSAKSEQTDVSDTDRPQVMKKAKAFSPRGYQVEIYEVAAKKNTIAVLETGTGKTMIAVMLMKTVMSSGGAKKLTVFLAPTVSLIRQQYEEIKIHTDLNVAEYYGAMGVDDWDLNRWEQETSQIDVLVMTPQIFLDALRKAFMSLDMVCLMIMDECHRATGNHPYAKIMKDFYHKSINKPKIFGMTASPVIRKGVSSATDCEAQLKALESLMDSQIFTVADRTEVTVFAPSAKEITRFYDQSNVASSDLKEQMETSFSKCDAALSKLQVSLTSTTKVMDVSLKVQQKRLANDHAKIMHCLNDLGPICAYEAIKVCQENALNTKEEGGFRESSVLHKELIQELLSIVRASLQLGDTNFLDPGFDYPKAVELGYISSKLCELLQVLKSFGEAEQVVCLIFVERIITAKVIERFVKKVAFLAHLKVSYMTGSNTSVDALASKVQKETLESFRSGKVNLLFTTDVVEEGIHIPNCSCVVRFDLPKTVRSYVQSRGRARQSDSQFVMLLERGNVKQRDHIFDLIRSESSMTDTALSRNSDACTPKSCIYEDKNVYYVDATKASVTADSSVRLIHQYCEKLPRSGNCEPKPLFEFSQHEGSYICTLKLPASAPVQTVAGPGNRSANLAKQLVCLEACKKLHEMGALDDHLIPCVEVPSKDDTVSKVEVFAPGAGTTKRKELHGTTRITGLSGTWGEKQEDAVFQAYKLHFSCSIVSELYSGFVLLIESTLDEDVANVDMDLYLVNKTVKVSFSPCGQFILDAEKTRRAKRFQEFLFNGVFGKLFVESNLPEKKREFLLQNETMSLWNPFYMYLLLPIETPHTSDQAFHINWSGINDCVSVVEFMRKKYLVADTSVTTTATATATATASAPEAECEGIKSIHFANGTYDVNNLRDMVVIAIHTGRIYSIVETVTGSSAEIPFEGSTDEFNPISYADYFDEKYRIRLTHPKQPLVRLKQSHNPHNLLVDFNDTGASKKASQTGIANDKPQMHAYMPPELLVSIAIPRSVLRSLYLLPSVMHRVESLMLATQLRKEIDCHTLIPSSLILEALTTLRCCETFSMERLELLGDSILKYAVTCNLFLNYTKNDEGQLSSSRQLAICNSTLYRLGTERKLQGYIRDCAFDPRRWVAPGQLTLRPIPCKHDVDTSEVPLNPKFHAGEPSVVLGKWCDAGHRWMGSKTISDCVEALIGAYYVGGGLSAALHMMKWLGVKADLDESLLNEFISSASLRSYSPKTNDLESLESKLGYNFSVKLLLQEAITHATQKEFFSYERLEFLGDAVLDVLITCHLYESHRDIDPGELTDLRSACVSNESFARVAVRKNLYCHLHCSSSLLSQIAEYVKSFPEPNDNSRSAPSVQGPKALGDMVESIAGAMLIDTKLDLSKVWSTFKPLLSPLVTPYSLELPPFRELTELCDSHGYFIKEKSISKGDGVFVELTLQLDDVQVVGEGYEMRKKLAKAKAASVLLTKLEVSKLSDSEQILPKKNVSRSVLKRKKEDDDDGITETSKEHLSDSNNRTAKRIKVETPTTKASTSDKRQKEACSTSSETPTVIKQFDMKKGAPRIALYELCKKKLWPTPKFETSEKTSKTAMEFCEGLGKKMGFCSFTSIITLLIPGSDTISCKGEAKADKKSSYDSAAIALFDELRRRGKVVIGNTQ